MRNLAWIPTLPYKLNPIQDITDTLPKRDNPNPPRKPDEITHISIHHSGVEGGTIQGYANYHVNKLGWPVIGYHIVIKGDQTYQVNDLVTFSYHTSGHNHYSVGISVSANLSQRPLSDVEKQNLYGAILTVMKLYNIPVEHVLGHNEFSGNNTSCPCIDMEALRNDIKTILIKKEQGESWEGKLQAVKGYANQVNYMMSLLEKGPEDGNSKWSMTNLQQQIASFKASNLL